MTISRVYGWTPLAFTTTLQSPLMIAFFTTIGFGASLSLLRVGGPAVVLFFVLSTIMAAGQNVIGVAAAYALGQHPLMGVLAGSVTLTGGPATGLAFAPLFEAAGVPAAATLAVAAAMAGIVAGGVVGGPVATWLLGRLGRKPVAVHPRGARALAEHVVEGQMREPAASAPAGEDVEAYGLLKGLVLILDRDVARLLGERMVRVDGRDVSRLYRRDAGRGDHPQPRRHDEAHWRIAANDR